MVLTFEAKSIPGVCNSPVRNEIVVVISAVLIAALKQNAGAEDLPITAPARFPGERSPHSFPENCAHQCAPEEVESWGQRSTICPYSGEDENLTAYYHGEKKFFLRIRLLWTNEDV